MNRGARGWDPVSGTLIFGSDAAIRQQQEALARMRRNDPNLIDMVQVNGVWMTPEDAHVAKTGYRAP